MIRGTTPDLEFELPFDTADLAAANIAFAQGGAVVFERELENMTREGAFLRFRLSQDETLSLSAKLPVEIQGRFRLLDETAVVSEIITEDVERILKNGVI